ncbi:MAG: hypothetical protein KAT29_09140, partial [Anaerolineales bacterium]|nr:hypothetical protein [Anaerolineales bacterium]
MEAQSEHLAVSARSRLVRATCSTAAILGAILLLGLVILPLQKSLAADTSDTVELGSGNLIRTNHAQTKSSILNSTASDSASNYLQVAQDLAITKTHSGSFAIGSTGVYTINVENVGTD